MEERFAFLRQENGINAFWLKIIAITGMTMDHIAWVFGGSLPPSVNFILYFAGGFTFPIMACLMAIGYYKTSNLRRYMLRLLVFALISQIPFMLAFHLFTLNVLFTLLLGLCFFWLYDNLKSRVLFWVLFVVAEVLSIGFDWGIFGLLLMVLLHLFVKNGKSFTQPLLFAIVPMFLLSLVMGVPAVLDGGGLAGLYDVLFAVGSLCVIPLMKLYNGRQGMRVRYLFYIYYPAHLAALVLLSWLVCKTPPTFPTLSV